MPASSDENTTSSGTWRHHGAPAVRRAEPEAIGRLARETLPLLRRHLDVALSLR